MVLHTLVLSLAVFPGPGDLPAPSGAQRPILVAEDEVVGPTFLRKIPGVRLLFGDYGLTQEEFDTLYGEDAKSKKKFDESYYEPKPATPTQKSPVAAKPATTAKVEPPPATALSCEKATMVVSSFGFSSVEAASCTGKIYAFNAQRDGKAFSIKLDSASGELTDVKKLP
jgi:hypothetical protein